MFLHLFDISSGGMGRVELALRRDGSFQRLYALKRLLHGQSQSDESFEEMLRDESRLGGLLQHPNVVSVLDVGLDSDGVYLAMEYIEGVTIKQLASATKGAELLLPVQLCCRILAQAARGLHAAHELRAHDGTQLGLVHRDFSPQNVLIGFDGVVRVADFGIARAEGRATQTSTGVLKGKAGYMSPEQLRFEELDRRSDLFSLGVVLYELLTTRRLYHGSDSSATARSILHEPPPDIIDDRQDIPPALADLLFRLLAKERENRPPDAEIVAGQLDSIADSVVAMEGRIDVGQYICEAFREYRIELRKRISDAIEGLDEVTSPVSRVPLFLSDAKTEFETKLLTRPRRSKRRYVLVVAIAVVLMFGLGLLLVEAGLFSMENEVISTPYEQFPSTEDLIGPTELPRAALQDPSNEPPSRVGGGDAGGDGSIEEREPDGGRVKRSRPRRRWHRRRPRPRESAKSPRTWSWD